MKKILLSLLFVSQVSYGAEFTVEFTPANGSVGNNQVSSLTYSKISDFAAGVLASVSATLNNYALKSEVTTLLGSYLAKSEVPVCSDVQKLVRNSSGWACKDLIVFKANRNSAQLISNGSFLNQKVLYNNVVFNQGGGTFANGEYTTPEAGFYRVSGLNEWTNYPSINGDGSLGGTRASQGPRAFLVDGNCTGAGTFLSYYNTQNNGVLPGTMLGASTVVQCSAGSKISMSVWHDTGFAITIGELGGAGFVWMSVEKL